MLRLAARPRPGGPGLVSRPRVVCAPDKLRGALDAFEAGGRPRRGRPPRRRRSTARARSPTAVRARSRSSARPAPRAASRLDARDALGRPRRAAIGDCGDGTFLVEAAEAVGLALLARRRARPAAHELGGPRRPAARCARPRRAARARGAGRLGDGRRRPGDAGGTRCARARRDGRGAAGRARARSRARAGPASRECS